MPSAPPRHNHAGQLRATALLGIALFVSHGHALKWVKNKRAHFEIIPCLVVVVDEGSGIEPWERSNSWVLEMARTRGAKKITLIALWDGKAAGDAPGGTAQMVQIARRAGNVDIVRIDASQLLH